MSDIQKFTYLKSFLKGEAESAITCLTLISDNYPIAIDILHSRFGNKQLRISAHMKELRSLQPVVHLDDIVSMCKLYNTLELNINNLKELEVDASTYGTLLIAITFDCIPDELSVKASLQFGEKDWSLKGTLEITKHELEARERSSVIKKEQFEYNSRDYVTTQNLKFDTVKENFQNKLCRKSNGIENREIKCVFCKGRHISSRCRIITDVNTRFNIVRRENRCFVCLKKNHRAQECRLKYTCIKCNKKHNISLCQHNDVITSIGNGEKNLPTVNEKRNNTIHFENHETEKNGGFVDTQNVEKYTEPG